MRKLVYIMLSVVLLCSSITSCRQIRYVPVAVESVVHDSVYLTSQRVDSVYVRDSVHVTDKGDTVVVNRYQYIYKYRDHIDTLYINRIDTIRQPYPVEVEKKLSSWQQIKINLGGYAIFFLIVLAYIVFRLLKQK